MTRELLIYTNHDVALRHKRNMEKRFQVHLTIAAIILALSLIPKISGFFLYLFAGSFMLLAGLCYYSKDSMLNDAENGLLMFRFTPEGWYRNERSVLYRWEDFKRVEFLDRAIVFHEAKQHKIHSSTISPMLMTDNDFDQVERWIRQYLPENMKS